MITEMAEAKLFFLNVREDDGKGREEERSYLAIYSDQGKKPLVLGRITPEGLVLGQPSPKMRDLFFEKLEGRDLPVMGSATEPVDVEEDVPSV